MTEDYCQSQKKNNCNNGSSINNDGKVLVIGIGGISRAGKSTLRNFLINQLNPVGIFHIDDYLISPIKVFDTNINDYIENWEDPIAHNLDKFYEDLKFSKQTAAENGTSNQIQYIITEGFLLYNRKDISDLIDLKLCFVIEKELCRNRRKSTKFYGSDYYFDEYIWKLYHINK